MQNVQLHLIRLSLDMNAEMIKNDVYFINGVMKNNLNRRTREKQEFRFRVLDVARDLFARYGEEAVTLRRVAEKVEYSATAIYQHFPNKRTLIEEVCAADFAVYSRVFKQAERLANPIECLEKMCAAYIDFGLLNPWHYRVVFMSAGNPASDPASSRDADDVAVPGATGVQSKEAGLPFEATLPVSVLVYNFLHVSVFRATASGGLRNDLRDPDQTTQTLWCGLHGIVSLHLLRSSYPRIAWRPVERTSAMMIDCLLRGILRDPLSRGE